MKNTNIQSKRGRESIMNDNKKAKVKVQVARDILDYNYQSLFQLKVFK